MLTYFIVLEDTLRLYNQSEFVLSYSGGKEACVLLYLLGSYFVFVICLYSDFHSRYLILRILGYVLYKKYGYSDVLSRIRIIYFHDSEVFPELSEFNAELSQILNIQFITFTVPYKDGWLTYFVIVIFNPNYIYIIVSVCF